MRLFVFDKRNPHKKIYLNVVAPTRRQLAAIIGPEFRFEEDPYHFYYAFRDVYAESGSNDTLKGGILGAVIGLLGGPIGAFLGGISGSLIGKSRDEDEYKLVEQFNRS